MHMMTIGKRFLLVMAAALVAAAPAFAQRASLADRVAALEAQANNSQANLDLLNKLGQQENELRELRAQIEKLQNDLDQMQQRNRDQYLDLDGRMERLEGGGVPPVSAPGAPAAPAAAPAGKSASAAPSPAPRIEPAPSVHGDVGAMAQAGDERTAYNLAFDKLKSGDYVGSAQMFTSFLQAYPNGVYAPNALYWLGESYYVTQNYALASEQFQAVVDRYPTHDKAPGSLLKLGLSNYGLGKIDVAERVFTDVVSRYPGTDVARTADDRLRDIHLRKLR
ncbi:tol-pal system protein YbgF [Pseudoxanthomonas indica]|uniref:Cell division coordinator CpoB n=2 Tax=Pseudoxanthomonas indica TaxID=428993 RepID=A0A1T5LH73_9GAMM|nr:tol-pal system protein YbgF [Pseudoxanthomonas indica]SKC75366.1 tol-pal system protein YbgF [Pseudoxanthomonas indica]